MKMATRLGNKKVDIRFRTKKMDPRFAKILYSESMKFEEGEWVLYQKKIDEYMFNIEKISDLDKGPLERMVNEIVLGIANFHNNKLKELVGQNIIDLLTEIDNKKIGTNNSELKPKLIRDNFKKFDEYRSGNDLSVKIDTACVEIILKSFNKFSYEYYHTEYTHDLSAVFRYNEKILTLLKVLDYLVDEMVTNYFIIGKNISIEAIDVFVRNYKEDAFNYEMLTGYMLSDTHKEDKTKVRKRNEKNTIEYYTYPIRDLINDGLLEDYINSMIILDVEIE